MTVRAPLAHSRPLDATLPPMPRRQSCDRCHEQKVRCVTEGCRKAGAVCVYSPQLRSGRPKLRRDSSAYPSRKRARRVSRCSSSSSPSPTMSHSASPASSSRPSTAIASFSSGSIGLGIMEHPDEHTYEHVAAHLNPVLSPAPGTPLWEQASHPSSNFGTPPATSQWQTPPYSSYDNHFLPDMCQVPPLSDNTPTPDIPCIPLQTDLPQSMISTAESDYSWSFTTLRDYFPEELAQINLRIHLAARALPARANTLALLSSPAVNDVLDAAYSLINLVDRRTSNMPIIDDIRQATPQHAHIDSTNIDAMATPFDSTPLTTTPSAIDPALDTSTSLVIHASHQAVLGVFEDISSSLLQYLSEPQQHGHGPTPPTTPPNAPPLFPACKSQAMVMANLMSHLLSELDRAVRSLAGKSSSSASAPGPGGHEPLDVNQAAGHGGGGGDWREGVVGLLWGEMERRQVRVGGQVKAVERLLLRRRPNGLEVL